VSDDTYQVPPGLCVVTTYGQITGETAQSLLDAQAANIKAGLNNITYRMVGGALVDKARNDACQMMLDTGVGWILFIDGDMAFNAQAILQIATTAYGTNPEYDVMGGYCNLRGDLAIPTVDTGTGTWESHFPRSGVKEVIRTGGAFLLVKRHVCERIPRPWFAVRVPMRPLDAMAEVDNFARTKFDGDNPFRNMPEWSILEQIAAEDRSVHNFIPAEVGEDSGFCDRVRNHGMRIAVDTSIEVQHLHKELIGAQRHKEAMAERHRDLRLLCGIME